jgi:hypothetical protein
MLTELWSEKVNGRNHLEDLTANEGLDPVMSEVLTVHYDSPTSGMRIHSPGHPVPVRVFTRISALLKRPCKIRVK